MGKKKAGARAKKGATATASAAPAPAPAPRIRGFWDKNVRPSGEAPSPRGGHSATLVGSCLYVFGGGDRSPCTFDDLHVLEIDAGKPLLWRRVDKPPADKGGEWPEARTDHAAAAAAGVMWVMGGQDPVGRAEAGCDSQYLPFDVWTLAPAVKAEMAPEAPAPAAAAAAEAGQEPAAESATPQWQLRVCDGAPPCPRGSHGLVLAGDGTTLAVVGGVGDEGPVLDLHLLDTETLVWSQLLLAPATAPVAREMHACFCLPGRVKVDKALAAEEDINAGETGSELVVMGGRSARGEILAEMEILNLGAAILLESAAEPLPDDAPDLAEMVEAGTAGPLEDPAVSEAEPEPEPSQQQPKGKGGAAQRAPALSGGKRMKAVPMPKALCAQAVAWWPAASAATSAAPLPLSFGGTDGVTGADGSVWSLRATPDGNGKGRAEWQWDVVNGLGGAAPTGRFAHTFTALPQPDTAASAEGSGGAGRPWPTALVFGGSTFETELNDLHLLWTA